MKDWNPYVYTAKRDHRVWENLCDLLLALSLGAVFTVLILYWFDILG